MAVAAKSMNRSVAPYYPPRARWYSPVFDWGNSARRQLSLDRILLPKGVTFWGFAGSLLIPGLGIYLRGPRLWGQATLAACGFLFLQFIMWLGYPFGNYAFGLMLSIHVTGLAYYCSPLLAGTQLRYRLLFTVLVLMGLGGLIYSPLRSAVQEHWLLPLRMNGHVVVVQRLASAHTIRRGDWIAYTLSGYVISGHGDQYRNGRSGLGLGPVLAIAGDRVAFSTNCFAVNDIPHPLLPQMPVAGSLIVPRNHWFIWPNLAISGHGYVSQTTISSAMLQMADVSDEQFVGKPFKHWFGRRQSWP